MRLETVRRQVSTSTTGSVPQLAVASNSCAAATLRMARSLGRPPADASCACRTRRCTISYTHGAGTGSAVQADAQVTCGWWGIAVEHEPAPHPQASLLHV